MVGGLNLPLWKILRIVSWDDDIPFPIYIYIYTYGKIQLIFQTTNQYVYLDIYIYIIYPIKYPYYGWL